MSKPTPQVCGTREVVAGGQCGGVLGVTACVMGERHQRDCGRWLHQRRADLRVRGIRSPRTITVEGVESWGDIKLSPYGRLAQWCEQMGIRRTNDRTDFRSVGPMGLVAQPSERGDGRARLAVIMSQMDESYSEENRWEIDLWTGVRSIQTVMPSGKIVWFRPQNRFELVYGKNGTGKSNFIQGLTTLWCRKPEGSRPYRSRAFISLPPTPFLNVVDIFHSVAKSQPKDWSSADIAEAPLGPWDLSEHRSISASGGFEYWYHSSGGSADQMRAAIALLTDSSGFDFSSPFEWGDDPDPEYDHDFSMKVASFVIQEISRQSEETKVADFRRNGGWIHEVLFPSVRKEIGELIGRYGMTNDSVRESYERHGLEFPPECDDFDLADHDNLKWSELLTVYLSLAIGSLEASLSDIDLELFDGLAEDYFADTDDEGNPILDVSKIIRLLVRPLRGEEGYAFFHSSLWIERDWERDPKRWAIGLAIPMDHEAAGIADLMAAFLDDTHPISELLANGDFHAATWHDEVRENVRHNWDSDADEVFRSALGRPDPSGDYFAFTGRAFPPIAYLDRSPIPLVDLDASLDLDEFVKSLTADAVTGDYDERAMLLLSSSPHEGEIALPRLEKVNELLAELAHHLRGLDLGITDCKLFVTQSLNRWVSGDPSTLMFRTVSTGDVWAPFESLSSAQKYWVSAVLKLMHAEHQGRPFLVLADEPERGIHERAVSAIYKKLGELGVPTVIATHSPSAFRQRLGTVHHLELSADGAHLTEVGSVSDVAAAAERFGLKPLDLLATRRTMVIVEGVHDKTVIEELLSRSPDRAISDRVLIASMSGVANMASIADAHLLTEFTDMNVLAISDNASVEELRSFRVHALELLRNGVPASEVIKRIGIDEAERHTTQEQRYMFALLKRAIHRSVLDRIRLHPVSARDIQETIPHTNFGLVDDWETLRREHAHSGSRESFKKWLSDSKSVRITASSIKKAMRALETLPEELASLLTELEIAVAMSGAFEDDAIDSR